MDPTSLPASAPDLLRLVGAALDGGPAVVPLPRLGTDPLPEGTAAAVRTSGSTGTPREVALTATALRASAVATHARLGGPGRWVLSLPPTHVAGLQVMVRAVLSARAGVADPLTVGEPGPFTPDGLAALLSPALADGAPAYVSLVPTQLHRVLAAADDGAPAGLDALVACGAVLLGGAATPAPLLARATAAGVRVVRTYGMSETAGGCVYDGVPLDGVAVRLAGPDAGLDTRPAGSDHGAGAAASPPRAADSGPTGRGADVVAAGSGAADSGATGVVELAGPVLAAGYLGDPAATAAAFRTDSDGTRWFRTSDLGRLAGDGTLAVLGRADDVVVTGGVNVAPAPVEALLTELATGLLGARAEACVVGVPDHEWGQAVVALLATPGAGDGLTPVDAGVLAAVREEVAARLGGPSAPRRVYVTGSLPVRGPGKVDRRAVAAAVAAAAARG